MSASSVVPFAIVTVGVGNVHSMPLTGSYLESPMDATTTSPPHSPTCDTLTPVVCALHMFAWVLPLQSQIGV